MKKYTIIYTVHKPVGAHMHTTIYMKHLGVKKDSTLEKEAAYYDITPERIVFVFDGWIDNTYY